jgi:hypothetical protein
MHTHTYIHAHTHSGWRRSLLTAPHDPKTCGQNEGKPAQGRPDQAQGICPFESAVFTRIQVCGCMALFVCGCFTTCMCLFSKRFVCMESVCLSADGSAHALWMLESPTHVHRLKHARAQAQARTCTGSSTHMHRLKHAHAQAQARTCTGSSTHMHRLKHAHALTTLRNLHRTSWCRPHSFVRGIGAHTHKRALPLGPTRTHL